MARPNPLFHQPRPLASRLLAGAILPALLGLQALGADDQVSFNRDILPILADHCYHCHGFDPETREAGLRLDLQQDAIADRGGYAAIVPGDPDASELFARISASDPRDRMPPPEHPKTLAPEQIELLRQWIEQGATWEEHWAFQPPHRPDPPATAGQEDWQRNQIDAFVLQQLRTQGLQPAPEADRRTLIRRLSFDLTGLPPTPEQVRQFVDDDSPDAYEALVERLLESVHHAERMTQHWLDLVRYADSVGYHGDQEITVWPFRDWVIEAFRQNMPFDQFTREQLAGDLLPDATREQQIASAYNRLGMMSAEGGGQDREYHAKYASDRVRNASTVWMGVTLGCAECHNHKFDPFSIEDFYTFAAFFADIAERGIYGGSNQSGQWGEMMPLPTPEQEQRQTELNQRRDTLQARLTTTTPELAQAQTQWEQLALADQWRPLDLSAATAANGTELKPQDDGSLLAAGPRPETDSYQLVLEPGDQPISALRLEALPHDSLPHNGPGRADNGNFVLTGISARWTPSAPDASPDADAVTDDLLTGSTPAASHEQTSGARGPYQAWSAQAALDGGSKVDVAGWAILPQTGQANHAVFTLPEPLDPPAGHLLEITLEFNYPHHSLGRLRVTATSTDQPSLDIVTVPDEVRAALQIDPGQRADNQQAVIRDHFLATTPLLADTRDELATVTTELEQLDKQIERMPKTVSVEPRVTRVFPRGNWMDDSGEVVLPQVPEFFAAQGLIVPGRDNNGTGDNGDARMTRLDLAEWLTRPDHPLTARVFVNRLWAMFHGHGLAKVLDDFGYQSQWPSHPELLDWLATEFVESGWDVRHMLRLMVTSATYRQDSRPRPELMEIDPHNRLLARQLPFRLDAEFVRDNVLAVSGLLVPEVGGRSVRPYQPEGYYAMLNFPRRTYRQDTGDNLWRRSVYTHWQRQYLHPAMLAFDAPGREECTAERVRSNTPLQALVLLNDPVHVEAARVLAERVLTEVQAGPEDPDGTTRTRIDHLFMLALSRPPDDAERATLTELHQGHLDHYRAHPDEAAKVLTTGERPPAQGLDPVEVAAWTGVARAVFNLHELITRY